MVGSSTAAVQQQLLQPGVLVSKHVGTGDGSYGEVTEDVVLPEPVLITGITVQLDAPGSDPRPVVFKAWAHDLNSPAAARFAVLIGTVQAPCLEAPVAQVFPTQRVVLRIRCSKATVQLAGFALSSAPAQIKAAAEAHLCPLPDLHAQLALPSTQQQRQQQQQQPDPAAAPRSMPRLAGQLLPLRKMPPAFVLILAPLAKFWGAGHTLPLAPDVAANSADLQACEQMATAVLTAKRGNPSVLMAKLTTTANPYNFAVDWGAIRDGVLDMATYCCSAVATKRVNTPDSIELAMAGVCAGILVAACQETAVELLTWPGRPRPAAIAITELVSVPHPPQRLQDFGSGLIDLLMDSCPTLACTALQGTFNPCKAPLADAKQRAPAARAGGGSGAAGSGAKPWKQPWKQAAASSDGQPAGGSASHVAASPAKKQRLDSAAGSGAMERRGSVGSVGAAAAAPAAHASESDVNGLVDAPRRQSGVGAASAAGSEAGTREHAAFGGGSQGVTSAAAAAPAVKQGEQPAEEDDGGLYEGLRGDGATSRSESAGPSQSERPGGDDSVAEGDQDGSGRSRQQEGGQDDGEGRGQGGSDDGYEDSEGDRDRDGDEGVEGYSGGEEEDDLEQLDFEDTEYTAGMHGDDPGSDVEQQYAGEGAGSAEGDREEAEQDGQADGGEAGSSGQQHGSEQDGAEQQGGGQQEDSRQQRQPQEQQSEGETEDGEYRTDEGDYAVVEDPQQGTGTQTADPAAALATRQPPLPQLYHGQLYNAVLKLALTPLHPDAAASCSSVLRRLRAYQCLDALQSTVGPMLAGKVNALLLSPTEFCAHISQVAAAASDLSTLVLQPPQSSKRSVGVTQAAAGAPLQLQPQRQEADACVLQLMLAFRVLDLLAAFVVYISVHVCRLVQLQKQLLADLPTAEQQQQHMEAAEQQSRLCLQHAQLLDSIRAMTSALTASSGGWSFLTAARDGLAALAAAVCPTRQVCLDGGHFSPDTSAPYDPQHGWEAARQALTAAASGLADDTTGGDCSAAGDLSDSLQRLWLLVEATAALQGAGDVLSGASSSGASAEGQGGIDKLSAALLTLFKGGLASELGQQSLVSALSSSTLAVRQLVVLLEHCGKAQAAAAGQLQQQQGQGLLAVAGLDMDDLLLPGQERPSLVYGALYVPDILLTLMSSPHPDALTAWLPLSAHLSAGLKALLAQQERHGAGAAQAAFPDLQALASSGQVAGACSCLPTAVMPGGPDAARQAREQLLWELHGCVMTGERLVNFWRGQGDGTGSGSGAELLGWLSEQLPALVAADDGRSLRLAEDSLNASGVGLAGHSRSAAPDAVVGAATAAAVAGLDGVAAVTGVPPPWGQDVGSDAVVELMRNAACRSAALCSLHLLDMLLRGAPHSIRTMARRAADRRDERQATPYAPFNPNMTLNPDGTLGPQGPHGCAAAPVAQGGDAALLQDGFDSRELVCELLAAGVLDVLERALRTATVALRASDAALVWSVRGGSQQDILSVLQARTAAAALMRAACTTTASLLVHLSDAYGRCKQLETELKPLEACSLLDAIVCAHSAVVTCQEGLQACVPQQQLLPFISRATDPGLDPVQRAAADAAVGAASLRACAGRVLLLLEARQALAVCLRCWQLQGWWPDPVGALLGSFPCASTAAEGFAKEDTAARKAGDPSARPPPPPRQGPRQLLSSLLGLADLCPEEWPHRGASQVAARQRDTAAAEGRDSPEGSPFERPSLIGLRVQLALSLEAHWDKLEALINFGLSCSTRVARLALVRMLARMCGVGGGTSPQLGPAVFGALTQRLEKVIQTRNGLAARLAQIKAGDAPPQLKQQQIRQEVELLVLQLRGATQVCEVLLPLCGAPSIKSVLTEHKAAGVLGKAVYALVKPAADLVQLAADEEAAARAGARPGPTVSRGLARVGSEVQVLAGLLLQLVSVLMDADISMNPWADSFNRELHDTPPLAVARAAVSYMLAAAEGLSPPNLALLAELLVGPSAALGTRCLYDYPKGKFVLRLAARHWHALATGIRAQGSGMTQAELQASAEWAAATLEATQCGSGPDPSHAASCAAIAQVLRELAAAGAQEGETLVEAERTRPATNTISRFVSAVKTATAAHRPGGRDSQAVSTLLSSAPLLLACDASCLDFWTASAASADYLQATPAPPTTMPHSTAAAAAAAHEFWPHTQLVGLPSARIRSRAVAEVTALAQSEQQQQEQMPGDIGAGQPAGQSGPNSTGQGLAANESAEVPAVMARRGPARFGGRDGHDPRHVAMHVDDFERQQQHRRAMHAREPGHMMQPMQHMGGGLAMPGLPPAGIPAMPGMHPGMVGMPGPAGMMMAHNPLLAHVKPDPDQMPPEQQQMLLMQQQQQQEMLQQQQFMMQQQQPQQQLPPTQLQLRGQQPWQQERQRGRGRW